MVCVQEKEGTAFMLVDSFAAGVIGMLSVSSSVMSSLRLLSQGLDFINVQLAVNRSQTDKLLPTGSFRTATKEIKRRIEQQATRIRQRNNPAEPAITTTLPPPRA